MAENSNIEWTDHTFNPWIGCTKVSPACDHCYAEKWDARFGGKHWGVRSDRRLTKTWRNPIKLNKQAEGAIKRPRVFCASLADVFDNHKSIKTEWRANLWNLIKETPNLDWLLLTKRPQNIAKMLPDDWRDGYPNVWLGTTVENQVEANRRIPHLLSVPAKMRFLSCEPLLGEIDLTRINHDDMIIIDSLNGRCSLDGDANDCNKLDWIITGGESGPNFRHANPDWFRSLRDQCEAAGTAFLFKQWEGRDQKTIKAMGRKLDGIIHNGYPT